MALSYWSGVLALVDLTVIERTRRIRPAELLDTGVTVSSHLLFVDAYGNRGGWDAIGDPTRRAIIECLAEQPQAVGELAAALPVSRPAVSQHLKVLKDAGLVTERTAGTRRIYRLNPTGVAALRDQLDTFWNRALAAYSDVVEQPPQETP